MAKKVFAIGDHVEINTLCISSDRGQDYVHSGDHGVIEEICDNGIVKVRSDDPTKWDFVLISTTFLDLISARHDATVQDPLLLDPNLELTLDEVQADLEETQEYQDEVDRATDGLDPALLDQRIGTSEED